MKGPKECVLASKKGYLNVTIANVCITNTMSTIFDILLIQRHSAVVPNFFTILSNPPLKNPHKNV